MESQNIEFRAVIKFLTKEGAKAKEIHRRMADVYGDSSPKYSTVAKWSAEFKRDSLEDDQRPGRPADVISQEMIDCVERLVLNNRQIKVAELASECGISNGSVYTIIHEHLGMSKVSARWVPKNLNMQDRQQRVESSQELLEVYNANPEDFHTRLVTGDETWLHHWDPDTKKVLLLHDNAPVHKSRVAQAAIPECKFKQLNHLPYSLDLAPSDYYNLKSHLRGTRFRDDELKAATEAWFEDQIDDFYFKGIDCLKEKWAKCIEVKGDYIEK